MEKDVFEKRIKPLLQYIGFVGAAITCVAYIIIVVVMIVGFKVNTILQTTTFSVVNAAIGMIVMQLLKYQGQVFAQNIPENKEILKQYYNAKTADKKHKSMSHYWKFSILKDALIKCVCLAGTSIGLVYIAIEGSKDYKLILLAIANLVMFICFGLLGLNSSYEYFNNQHIPYIKERLKESQIPQKEEKQDDHLQ